MSINENLTSRVRSALSKVSFVEEKRMFSGITFMVDGKMCISVGDDRLMCRIDPDRLDEALRRKACRTVVMKGREYKGFVYVNQKGIDSKEDFDYWIDIALDYNKVAKATGKKRKKV